MPHKPLGNCDFAWMLILILRFFSLLAPGSGSQHCSDFHVPAFTFSWSEKEHCAFKPNSLCVLRGKHSTDTWFIKLHTHPGNFSSSQTRDNSKASMKGGKKIKYKGKRAPALCGCVGCSAVLAWWEQQGEARQKIPEYPAFKYAGASGTQQAHHPNWRCAGDRQQTPSPSHSFQLLCYQQKN